jgi:hypothetical protein
MLAPPKNAQIADGVGEAEEVAKMGEQWRERDF